jgi:hypothetical protein
MAKFSAMALALFLASIAGATENGSTQCVRFVYLVSADREVKAEYLHAVERAARGVRDWYAGQLDGATFHLHNPVVEVLRSDKKAAWFTSNPNGRHRDNWGFNNTLSELKLLRGALPGQDGFAWVLYSDGPGNKGRAVRGYAYLPEDDLLGLVGKHPTQPNPKRWEGGLGHELGHALGLPHPADTKKHARAIMWAGFYGHYPKGAYLTGQDKRILRANPLIVAPAER